MWILINKFNVGSVLKNTAHLTSWFIILQDFFKHNTWMIVAIIGPKATTHCWMCCSLTKDNKLMKQWELEFKLHSFCQVHIPAWGYIHLEYGGLLNSYKETSCLPSRVSLEENPPRDDTDCFLNSHKGTSSDPDKINFVSFV